MTQDEILSTITKQREFFASGVTLDRTYRETALAMLYDAVQSHEDEIADAIHFAADVVIPGAHFSERISEGNIERRRHADTHDVVSVFLSDVGVQHDVRRHTDIGHDAA